MKWNKEEFNKKRKQVPRGTYIIMTMMGVYMFYILSRIQTGLSEPDVSAKILIYLGMLLIGVCGILFIGMGIRAIVKGEYAEAQPEEEETDIQDKE